MRQEYDMIAQSTELDTYRTRARDWLAMSLERRSAGDRTQADRGTTPEQIAEARVVQGKLFAAGYAGIALSKEYGGQGLTQAHERVFKEEARGYRTPRFGVIGNTTFGVCAQVILAHATEEFKRRHMPRILAGQELWVQFFSEPGAGSDLAGVTTRADRDGDQWLLNGSKIWSSGAVHADYGMCLTRTNWDAPKHRGLTWFAVDVKKPGVTVLPLRQINGNSEFCQEFFDDVRLSGEDVIGEINDGWTAAQTMLVYERGGGRAEAGTSPGGRPTGRAFVPDLVEFARTRGLEKDGRIRQLIALVHTNDFMQGQLGARIAAKMMRGRADAGMAAYLKLAAGTFGPLRACLAMEIAGAGAVAWRPGDALGEKTSNLYLNSRTRAIAGGTNEMQRNGIGERVLGLPREPRFDSDKPFTEVQRFAKEWSGRLEA
jgi:alkylation response protein AidB-like acyl-CoA dehydrogenase